MGLSLTARNTMLDALTLDRIQLHDGDPGTDGTANVITGTMQSVTFSSATSGERALSADKEYTGLEANQVITYLSFWSYNGGSPIFYGSAAIEGDQQANSAGEYIVKAGETKIAVS